MRILRSIIEELRHVKVIVENGGNHVTLEEIRGKGINKIFLGEISYYLCEKSLDKETKSLIMKWIFNMEKAGKHFVIL